MRAMDIDSRHSADDVNRLSANSEHPVALVTRPTRAQRRSLSFQLPLWACRWPDAAAKSVPNEHDEEFPLPPVTPGERTRRTDLREQRRPRQHGCWDHLIVAPLWVAYEANLGTLLRTCDAVGACMAVPSTDHYHRALDRGDTLPRRPHVHWVRRSKLSWISEQRGTTRIVAVELAEDATPLTRLEAARTRTVVLLGHEHHGVPAEAWDLIDDVVEIPMVGRGASLNVAVAGSLVLYRLAGLM
jgi:tRNA(Leu) C34 or U34 (ribose-2'-O)-methylase TrmL